MQAIDMHCHFWADSFIKAARAGKEWYGWKLEKDGSGGNVLSGEGGGPYRVLSFPEVDLADPAARTQRRMESQGIDFQAVMPVGYLWSYHLGEADSVSLAREVNDELAELQRVDSAHYAPLAHLPVPHTEAAIAEVERVVKDLGIKHFALASHAAGRNLNDPSIVPVLDAIAEAGATLSLHPAFFDKLGERGRISDPLLKNGFGPPIEASLAFLSVIISGVLDRHPSFDVWVSHGGGAAMYSMGRLQRKYLAMSPDTRPMALPPKGYLRRFHYGNLVHDEAALRLLIEQVGADRITIGTDYPFPWDHVGGSANWIRGIDFITEDQRQDILWRNAYRFLKLGE